jgi:flagellar biosynthesis protein FlhG
VSANTALASLPPLPPRSRTIAFTSGKGGVGKSNLALNTGLLLAQRGRRVMILDGDLGLANITVLLGRNPEADLTDVIAGGKALHEILIEGPHGLRVIPAGAGVAELANLAPGEQEALLTQLRRLEATVDFLLIDTGAGLGDTVLNLILASDEAVLVTVPEPTALADAYGLMKTIVQRTPVYPFHLLVNMVRDEAQARQVHDALSQIARRFLGYQPGYAGGICMDPWVAQGVVRQVPFTTLAPQSRATRGLEALVGRMLGPRPPEARGARTFWQRLSGGARRP